MWVFSCKFAEYFQKTFSTEYHWRTAPVSQLTLQECAEHIQSYQEGDWSEVNAYITTFEEISIFFASSLFVCF